MSSALIKTRIKSDCQISHNTWENILNKYINQLNLEGRDDLQPQDVEVFDSVQQVDHLSYLNGHPVFRTPPTDGENWARLMPDDSVIRFNRSTDVFDTFSNITEETTKNILDADPGNYENLSAGSKRLFSSDWTSPLNGELKPADYGYVATKISSRLRGAVDFSKLLSDPGNPEEQKAHTPEGSVTVTVEGINSKNYEDWEVYDIENAKEFFGDSFGSNVHMAYDIMKSDIEPAYTISDIAFYLEGMSVQNVDCPKAPISLVSMDYERDTEFFECEKPAEIFSKIWGDTEKMNEKRNKLDRIGKYFTVDWRIVVGMSS